MTLDKFDKKVIKIFRVFAYVRIMRYMKQRKKIFVVILNFNNELDTIECINSLSTITDYELEVVVVDNNSKNPSLLEEFVSNLSNATFIQSGENRGYAAGNNIGIRFAIDHNAKYIAILNNDVIVNKDSFSESIDKLDSMHKVGFVSPTLLNSESDVIQSQGLIIHFGSVKYIENLNKGKRYIPKDGFNECNAIIGACMLFKPSLIETIGYIPEEYFLNFEETDWCCNAIQHDLKNFCSLKSFVYHKGSATINCYSNLSFYYYNRNIIIFLLKRDPIKIRAVYSIVILIAKSIVKTLICYKGNKLNKFLLLCYMDGFFRTKLFKHLICNK